MCIRDRVLRCRPIAGTAAKNSHASSIGMSSTSEIVRPLKCTSRVSRLYRAPWHTSHGTIKIEMNFLPDVYVPCEVCHGARYNRETLEVHFKGRTISDVLDMPIEEACEFFAAVPAIGRHLS